MSGRRDREARREERLREDQQAGEAERRQRLVKLASAAAFIALVVVAVLIVVSQGSGGGDASNISDVGVVEEQLKGIPQNGMVLGEPSAKVKLIEFGDLQCPVCKGYSEEVVPSVIENQVRSGEASIEFRNYTIIGPQSTPAGAAAIAAGKQGQGWNYVEIFYRNQGEEDSGYANDKFLTAIAKAAGVSDLARWNKDRKSAAVLKEVADSTKEAQQRGFSGTPSFAVEGPGTSGLENLGTPESVGSLESAVERAAG